MLSGNSGDAWRIFNALNKPFVFFVFLQYHDRIKKQRKRKTWIKNLIICAV